MEKTAIIGTGIAGMGCGYFLHGHTSLSLFEQDDHVGGHANTVTLEEDGRSVHIDTGFMVFNYATYPNLCRLFDRIHAPVKKADMSFSVQHVPTGLEYSNSSLNRFFAQRRNLLNPSHLQMLGQIRRFNRQSVRLPDDRRYADHSLRQLVKELDLGEDLFWKYLAPMGSAVWSTPMDKMLDFPAMTWIRVLYSLGFLGSNTQLQWWTIEKGSRSYRDLLTAPFAQNIRVDCRVVRVHRTEGKAIVETNDGGRETFDRVIFACHADQALALLADPTPGERRLLGFFHYQPNLAVLHTDASVMPRKRRAWGSRNYRIVESNAQPVGGIIYWMNRLQKVSAKNDYFLSVNFHNDRGNNHAVDPDPARIIRQFRYEHPIFDIPSVRAQKELDVLNREGPLYYCGSYFNYGFHEDAFASSVRLCGHLLGAASEEELWKSAPGV